MKKKSKNEKSAAAEQAEEEIAETTAEQPADEAAAEEAAAAATEAAEEEEGLRDRFLRLQADFDNFRKRVQREKAQWTEQANEDFMTDLVPILDHFEIGMETAARGQAEPAVVEGFRMVFDQFLNTLKKFGMEPVDAEGNTFDPHLHEAATYLPSENHPEESVISQIRRGYRLGNKLLRPAQVVVSSGPSKAAASEEAESASVEQEASTEGDQG